MWNRVSGSGATRPSSRIPTGASLDTRHLWSICVLRANRQLAVPSSIQPLSAFRGTNRGMRAAYHKSRTSPTVRERKWLPPHLRPRPERSVLGRVPTSLGIAPRAGGGQQGSGGWSLSPYPARTRSFAGVRDMWLPYASGRGNGELDATGEHDGVPHGGHPSRRIIR